MNMNRLYGVPYSHYSHGEIYGKMAWLTAALTLFMGFVVFPISCLVVIIHFIAKFW